VYLGLLIAWLVPGLHGPTTVLGWAHGLGWIAMSLLALAAVSRRIISMRLAVAVAILGAVGPFIGSAEFVRESRAREAGRGG
jgi:hypothetical protein